VCPSCNEALELLPNILSCERCKLQWILKDNIPDFSDKIIIDSNNSSTKEMEHLLHTAQNEGWQTALFNFNKEQVVKNYPTLEDKRMTDWRYLIPIDKKHTVLVLGCGLGVIPIALSEQCKKVYAVDPEWEKATFLNIRKDQLGIENLFPLIGNNVGKLPFNEESFDLVVILGYQFPTDNSYNFYLLSQQIHRLLKERGKIYFSLDNKWSFQRLFRPAKTMNPKLIHNLYGYKRILAEKMFSNIRFYAPLPQHNRTPMYYLSLDNNRAIQFYFESVFPLFDMVTPEVKKIYGVQYNLIKIIVKLALILRLTALAKFFVPGFSIIAQKK